MQVFYEEVADLVRERVTRVPRVADVQLDNVALELSSARSGSSNLVAHIPLTFLQLTT